MVETRPATQTRSLAGAGFDSPTTDATSSLATSQRSTILPANAGLPSTAEASVVPPAVPTTSAEASMRDRTLGLIGYPWDARLPGWRVEFSGSRAGLRGLTRPEPKVIENYVHPTDSPASLARVLAHEICHAVDLELNSDPDRERWREARGLPAGARWWPDSATSDFDTGAGDFAEAFAVWLTGVASLSRIGAALNTDHLALVAQLAG